MSNDFFSDLLFREPIIKDKVVKTDYQFEIELNRLKIDIPNATPKFEIEFKRPLLPIRKYYYKRISNETITLFNEMLNAFSSKNVLEENIFLYQKFYNVFSQNLNNIHDYIKNGYIKPEHYLSPESNYYSNEAYIIYFLKANAIMLMMELQNRFSDYRSNDILSIEEIYEVYFSENAPKDLPIIPISIITKSPITDKKPKAHLKFKPILGGIETRPVAEKLLNFKKIIKHPEKFSKLEERLFNNKIIDINYNFIADKGNKQLLAAFIHQMIRHQYIQSRFFPGNKVIKERDITKFFAHRYGYGSNCDKEFRNFKNKDRHKLQKLIDSNFWLDSII